MFVDVVVDQPIDRPLTYKATPDTLPYLQEGSLIEVTIGAKKQFGIVTKLRRHAPTQINNIRAIQRLYAVVWANPQSLKLAERLATYTGEAPGICLFRLLPPPSKRPTLSAETIASNKTSIAGKRFHLYAPRTLRFEHYLLMIQKASVAGQQTLMVVPNTSLPLLAKQLTRAKVRFLVASADLSAGKQRAIASNFNNGKIDVLIGTRHIIGWQAKCLRWLIVDDPTHAAHTDEQRPYADTATIAWLRHLVDGSHLILGTALPTLGMILAERRQNAQRIAIAHSTTSPIIASTPTRQLLLPDIEQLITDHLDTDLPIAIIAPRSGVGGIYTCTQCQWILRCKSCGGQVNVQETGDSHCYDCTQLVTKPTECLSCHSVNLNLIGIGDHSVRIQLERQFGTIPVNVQIGTATLLESEQHFKAIVFVYADSPLLSPQLDRPLAYARTIWEACGLSDRVVVQTREPTHSFWLFLAVNPNKAFNQTLERRSKSNLPPFSRHLKIEAATGIVDLARFPSAKLVRHTTLTGRDNIDVLIPTSIYQQTTREIAKQFPKARLKTDSILQYS
jgi:primosomal protein N'